MSKRIVIVLAVALSILFAGQSEASVAAKQNLPSANLLAPYSVSNPVHSATLAPVSSLPVPDIAVFSSRNGYTFQSVWMRLARYGKQGYTFGFTGHVSKLLIAVHSSKFTQYVQTEPTIFVSLGGSLSSVSPPGLILRL